MREACAAPVAHMASSAPDGANRLPRAKTAEIAGLSNVMLVYCAVGQSLSSMEGPPTLSALALSRRSLPAYA